MNALEYDYMNMNMTKIYMVYCALSGVQLHKGHLGFARWFLRQLAMFNEGASKLPSTPSVLDSYVLVWAVHMNCTK